MTKTIIVAAAGKGTRMGELTKDIPKPLIKVLEKPFIFYLLQNIKEAGFENIIVVTGYKAENLETYLKEYDPKIQTVHQFEKVGTEYYGTLGPLKAAKEYISDACVWVNGDNLYSPQDLSALASYNDDYTYVSGMKHKSPSQYGVLKCQNSFLEDIVEKPKEFVSDIINVGLYKFTTEVFSVLGDVSKSERGEYELVDALKILAEKRRVKVHMIQKYWYDFGSPEDISIVEAFLKN
ncbi:NTP transferase domain-containing protein [Patescibacteria group bacterium]|nr:NTP transferase domain-containing protein [Patescibacteria group bacterium]